MTLGLAFALAACGAGGGASSAPGGDDGNGVTTPAPLESGDMMSSEGAGETEGAAQ